MVDFAPHPNVISQVSPMGTEINLPTVDSEESRG